MNRQQRRTQQDPEDLHRLGLMAARAGDAPRALELMSRAIAVRPKFAPSHNVLGFVLSALGRREEALAAYRRALELDRGNLEANNNLGNLLRELGRSEEAIPYLERALELGPDSPDVHNNLGLALSELGRRAEAERALRRAIELRPGYASAHNNLGVLLQQSGRPNESIAAFRRAIEIMPGYASAINNLATALGAAGHSDEALAAFDRAAALQVPGYEAPLTNKAQLLMELGRSAESATLIEQALAVNPRAGSAWALRSELKAFTAADPDIPAMESLLASVPALGMRKADQIALEFALGKAWLEAGDAARAFAHFEAGNRGRRGTIFYDAQEAARSLRAIPGVFTADWIEALRGAGDPSELPIFVVGMPRSGTSLIEQILASHPLVAGAGELTIVGDIVREFVAPQAYPSAMRHLAAGDAARLGRAYLEGIAGRAQGHARVVDKMPMNFQFAGLIHAMLPNARIVHCRRDAMDTCLSCYTRNLHNGLGFCADQSELGAMYREYERLMAHWRALLPASRFLDVDYERVVEDLEGESRRLIDFCGLDWSENCLSFHETRRAVHTASANQVRRPIYRSSVGRWRAYAPHLAPLLAALGIPAPDGPAAYFAGAAAASRRAS